jgi:hypothetical protein
MVYTIRGLDPQLPPSCGTSRHPPTIILVAPLSPVPAQRGRQAGLTKVLGAVWLPGFGSALSTFGFGAMIAFSALLSAQHGWSPVWLTFSAFAISLVAARLFLGHVPDTLGGAKVALVCVFVEAAGPAGHRADAAPQPTLEYPYFGGGGIIWKFGMSVAVTSHAGLSLT